MILRGSRYEKATLQRVAGRPVKAPFSPVDAALYLRSRRHRPSRVPVPTDKVETRTLLPTVFPRTVDAVSTRIVGYRGYTVLMGDRLQDLAGRFYGDPNMWHLIANANPAFFDPDDLPPGTLLLIPDVSSTRTVGNALGSVSTTLPRLLTKPFDGVR